VREGALDVAVFGGDFEVGNELPATLAAFNPCRLVCTLDRSCPCPCVWCLVPIGRDTIRVWTRLQSILARLLVVCIGRRLGGLRAAPGDQDSRGQAPRTSKGRGVAVA
jgi:hypothetical protein